jgi:hypothetical protein
MPWFDLPLDQLREYRTDTEVPFTGHVIPTAHVERQLRHLKDFLR